MAIVSFGLRKSQVARLTALEFRWFFVELAVVGGEVVIDRAAFLLWDIHTAAPTQESGHGGDYAAVEEGEIAVHGSTGLTVNEFVVREFVGGFGLRVGGGILVGAGQFQAVPAEGLDYGVGIGFPVPIPRRVRESGSLRVSESCAALTPGPSPGAAGEGSGVHICRGVRPFAADMLPRGGYKFRPYMGLLTAHCARRGTLDELGAELCAEIDEGGFQGLSLSLPGAAGGGSVIGFARVVGAEGGFHILSADVADEFLAAEADGDVGIDAAVNLLTEALVVGSLHCVEGSNQVESRV
jgi:hypothetical protein